MGFLATPIATSTIITRKLNRTGQIQQAGTLLIKALPLEVRPLRNLCTMRYMEQVTSMSSV